MSSAAGKGERETTTSWSQLANGNTVRAALEKENNPASTHLGSKALSTYILLRAMAHHLSNHLSMSYQVPTIVTKVRTQYSSKNFQPGEDGQLQIYQAFGFWKVTFRVWISLSICSLWDAGQMACTLLSQCHPQKVVVKIKWGNTCAMTRTVPGT